MTIKYNNINISNDIVLQDLNRITNQIFKLLPLREEGGDWEVPLQNLIIEITGINELFDELDFVILLSKMEGVLSLKDEKDFPIFRRNIFECLSLLSRVKQCLG